RARVVRLDDEVQMVVLGAELQDPEAAVRGGGQRAAERREDPPAAEAANGAPRSESNVHGVRRDMNGAALMRNAGAAPGSGLPAGTGPTAAPGGRLGERELPWACHLIRR